jgi:hypothetical protein
MHPVLLFATGLLTGIVGVRAIKSAKKSGGIAALGDRTRQGADQARSGLRQATLSSLSAIEAKSASLRARLDPGQPADPAVEAASPVDETKP